MGRNNMKLLLIFGVALAVFGAVKCGSTPIYKHGARHSRSPIDLFGCNGKCNQQGYNAGRSLVAASAAVGGLGLILNSPELQKVGGTGLAAGFGVKGLSKLFGR